MVEYPNINDKYASLLPDVEKIIGNVKGGLKQPLEVALEIHKIYLNFINSEIRYKQENKIDINDFLILMTK